MNSRYSLDAESVFIFGSRPASGELGRLDERRFESWERVERLQGSRSREGRGSVDLQSGDFQPASLVVISLLHLRTFRTPPAAIGTLPLQNFPKRSWDKIFIAKRGSLLCPEQ
jgi:hypothetical protein